MKNYLLSSLCIGLCLCCVVNSYVAAADSSIAPQASNKNITTDTIEQLWGSIIDTNNNQTLTSIARQYNLDIKDLSLFNPQDPDSVLEEGIEIFLPYYDIRDSKKVDISRISSDGGTKIDLSALSRKTAEDAIGKFIKFVYDDIDMSLGTILSTRRQQ